MYRKVQLHTYKQRRACAFEIYDRGQHVTVNMAFPTNTKRPLITVQQLTLFSIKCSSVFAVCSLSAEYIFVDFYCR